ncbi:MAG: hypothetical protein Q8N77_04995 [Nanoarchaeota archaeon]|nr:hypothetical protein [Nanoarchaeota archaeon]
MKRKLIQMAGKTLVVSLPAAWVKKYNLKKGHEIDVLEKGKNLIISTEGEDLETNTQVDITDLPKAIVNRMLIGSYKLGFDEIKVIHHNTNVQDLNTNKIIPVNKLITDIINNFIGIEIVEEGKDYTLLKQVSKISEAEFDNVLRRIFFILNSMSKETLEIIKNKNESLQEAINQKHDTTEKLTNYCLRLLNKKGYQDYKKTSLLYYLISELEEIADTYNFIARESLEKNLKISKDTISLFQHVNNSWDNFYNIFYKYDKEKVMNILKDRKILWIEIDKLYKKASASDLILLGRISVIVIKILNLTEVKISMDL